MKVKNKDLLIILSFYFYGIGYIIGNLTSVLIGGVILIYLYLAENIFKKCLEEFYNREIKIYYNKELKEHETSKIYIKFYSKGLILKFRFSSNEGKVEVLKEKEEGDYKKYILEITPQKKGNFILKVCGEILDKVELNKTFYKNSFKFKVLPSVKGLVLKLEKENILGSVLRFYVEPEIGKLKRYEVGDDIRRIDWKKSIMLNELIIREVLYKKNSPIYYLLDAGYSMRKCIDKKKSKIGCALDILISLLKSKNIENDEYIFIYDEFKVKDIIFVRKTKIKEIINRLIIEPIKIEKYVPCKITIEKNNKYTIIHKYLSKGKKFGILNCVQHLLKMAPGTVIIITDLDSNIFPLIKGVKLLNRKGFRVIIFSIYSPSFNINEIDEKLLKKLHDHYISRKKIIENLKRCGALVIDISYGDNITKIIKRLKRRL